MFDIHNISEMAATSRFLEVPVVDVNASNIKELWPSLALALKSSTFVGLDTELSGLGNRKLLKAKALPDRYKNISDVAKTRSVLSLGLSCFKLQKVESANVERETAAPAGSQSDSNGPRNAQVQIKQWRYSVQTFNVTLLCAEDYMVEPAALKFLVEHGFDFNKQYAFGVSYHKGKGQPDTETTKTTKKNDNSSEGPTGRHLFDLLLWSGAPIVLHNGFLDLVFLYQNLYTDLPASLQVFLADLHQMFPQGVLDTKYLVEFVDRMPATYLEYVFRKWQRKNAFQACIDRREVCLEFGRVNKAHVSYSRCGLPANCVEKDFIPSSSVLKDLICHCFAAHGWCVHGKNCPKSHAIDLILDLDGAKTARNRKRRRKLQGMRQKPGKEGGGGGDMNQPNSSAGPPPHKVMRMDLESLGDCKNRSVSQSDACEGDTSTEDVGSDSVSPPPPGGDDDDEDYDSITEAYLECSRQLEESRSGGHRAGFDAFMTGFIVACILSKHSTVDEGGGERAIGAGIKFSQLSGVEDLCNKVYIMGKDQPMIVGRSSFCQPSKNHRERMEKVKKS